MLLTAQRLKELDACPEGIDAFQSMFPDGVKYSTELHQKLLQSEFAQYEYWCVQTGFVPALNVIVGNYGTAIAGYFGTANAGNFGIANAGNFGIANAGYCGTAIAGYCGTAIAGDFGIANAGHYGTATAGECGTAQAGIGGIINIAYWHDDRKRILTGYIGENGLLPNTKYKVENGEFVKA